MKVEISLWFFRDLLKDKRLQFIKNKNIQSGKAGHNLCSDS